MEDERKINAILAFYSIKKLILLLDIDIEFKKESDKSFFLLSDIFHSLYWIKLHVKKFYIPDYEESDEEEICTKNFGSKFEVMNCLHAIFYLKNALSILSIDMDSFNLHKDSYCGIDLIMLEIDGAEQAIKYTYF